MFIKEKTKITAESKELSSYIDGIDLYNSRLMDLIKDSYEQRISYEIRTYEFRPDLIAQDIYGDSKYMGIFLLTCGVGLGGLYKGAVISIFPKYIIDDIFIRLQRYG